MKGMIPNRMKKAVSLILAAALSMLSIAACKTETAESLPDERKNQEIESVAKQEETPEIYPAGTEEGMVMARFDEKLMAFLSKKAEGNYMVSPLSFRYALGLLLAGASGETKTELLNALGVKSEEEWAAACLRFNAFVKRFQEAYGIESARHAEYVEKGDLPQDSNAPTMALRVANSVWKNEKLGVPFTEEYSESISKNYDAEYFSFVPSTAVEKINEWVNEKTERMIDRLLPDGYDTTMLAVVLMNALYFKDSWISPFEEFATKSDEFRTKSGETVEKEFMHDVDNFQYYEDEETRLAVLPMKGGVSMAFVIGDASDIASKINEAEYRKVSVAIPKIDLETSFNGGEFVEFLKENGVRKAFDPENAEFKRMIDADVYVDDIIQKTRIKLNEDGVEAAAVTAIMMCGSSFDPNQPVEFTLDQPFSFFIYTNTGNEMATMFFGEIVE